MARPAAKRYARAVFELAQESGEGDAWLARLQELRRVLTDPAALAVLANPTLPAEERERAVDAIATPAMGHEGRNLARLLVASRRLGLIAEIVEEYATLVDEAAGRVRAMVTTAVELSDEERDELTGELARRLSREVRLDARVDPGVLGGLVLQYGDHVIDASLAARLKQLRKQLA